MAQVMNIHSPREASGFMSHYMHTVGCVARSNHWVVIGCLMSEIALVW